MSRNWVFPVVTIFKDRCLSLSLNNFKKCVFLGLLLLFFTVVAFTTLNAESQHNGVKVWTSSLEGHDDKLTPRLSAPDRIKPKNRPRFQVIPECGCTRKFLWPPSPTDMEAAGRQYNSTCSDEGTFYKSGQNVVSFSLYFQFQDDADRKRLYKRGIQENLQGMWKHYPGYTMRIYTDVTLEGDYCQFVCNNSNLFWCDIRKTPSLGDQSKMYCRSWRFLVLGDPTVDILLSRDLDSRIESREAAAVRDWLQMKEEKAIHLMRDMKDDHNIPILGGMWGARNSILRGDAVKIRDQIVEMSLSPPDPWKREWDQTLLNMVLFYPRRKDIVAHDSYHCERWRKLTIVRPFPTKRIMHETNDVTDFVGSFLNKVGRRNAGKCPVECRPSYGKDWDFC